MSKDDDVKRHLGLDSVGFATVEDLFTGLRQTSGAVVPVVLGDQLNYLPGSAFPGTILRSYRILPAKFERSLYTIGPEYGCRKILFILAAVLLLTPPIGLYATQADAPKKSYTVKRTSAAIIIDGKLEEPDWQACETITLIGYKAGISLRQATTCRMLWDDSFLYMSWFCTDSDIWGTLTKRDAPLYDEEVVEVFINPDGDRETYLELEINPLGTLWDAPIIRSAGGRNANTAWNSELVRAVHVEGTIENRTDRDSCWSVEIALPLSELSNEADIPPLNGDRWRLNLYRIDMPAGGQAVEYSAWSPVRTDFHDPDSFGEIVFSTEPVRIMRGDTDGNEKINIFDLLHLLRALADPSLSEGRPAYDVDANGTINIFDLLELLRKMKG